MKAAHLRLVEEALRLGYNILLVSMSRLPEPFGMDEARTIVVTRENAFNIALRVYGCQGCQEGPGNIYRDPDRLLDAAVVDKMLVI